MIKAEEIRSFMKKQDEICSSFNSCSECPVAAGNNGRCTLKYITQEQVDVIMNWEPPVDWSKVAPDTKIIVWETPARKYKRYFAKYENGKIYAFDNGSTSWSHAHNGWIEWPHGELAKDNE